MSTAKKLSEVLKNWSDSDFEDSLADDARALEERVAELEAHNQELMRSQVHWDRFIEAQDAIKAALTRAESAEKRLEGEIALGQEHYRARRVAESEIARLRDDSTWKRVEEAEGLYISMRDERDALRAKLDAVRAECERGRNDARLPWRVFASILAILDGEGGDE